MMELTPAAMIRTAQSAWEVPVIMFLIKSRWPGASNKEKRKNVSVLEKFSIETSRVDKINDRDMMRGIYR
jgi:hypothetical protein